MATANDIINDALTEIQVLEAGEIPSAADTQLGFLRLNNMMDSFQAERLMIFTIPRINLGNLTIGKQTYTLGIGGDFNIPRPARIERYGIITLNNPGQPLELPLNSFGSDMTVDQWAQIPVKNILSALPLYVWDDGGNPLRNLSYWCIPNALVQATIYPWMALTSFPDLVTDITFPPGYQECVMYQLALRLANPFGGNIPPLLSTMAIEAKARVMSFNMPMLDLGVDPALTAKTGYYNWISDQFGPGPR